MAYQVLLKILSDFFIVLKVRRKKILRYFNNFIFKDWCQFEIVTTNFIRRSLDRDQNGFFVSFSNVETRFCPKCRDILPPNTFWTCRLLFLTCGYLTLTENLLQLVLTVEISMAKFYSSFLGWSGRTLTKSRKTFWGKTKRPWPTWSSTPRSGRLRNSGIVSKNRFVKLRLKLVSRKKEKKKKTSRNRI